ncbi:hypothetical protein [Rhizobium sp. GCM10022189]|jgi:hypothetical protein|uniref:hypothetical protein n=1 Tax=Rhizobium sp. GCM10022189 TaxID=3252654 RepID=UPI00360B94D1
MASAPKVTEKRKNTFINALEDAGGTSGNSSLRRGLDWTEELYWAVQGRLIEEGSIVAGRGKGGSVRLTEAQAITSEMLTEEKPDQGISSIIRERDLYPALKTSIETKWINRFALDDVIVDETHSRGSKDTGGTFTRPDITTAGIRRYVYLPKRLEIVTFEVKTSDSITIMGVLEAIAHREAAHRAYVIYAASRTDFEEAIEAERIIELAQKYGVGIVLAELPEAVESWEILIDAIRHEPDPARLDRFLNDLPNADMKKQLSKWKE